MRMNANLRLRRLCCSSGDRSWLIINDTHLKVDFELGGRVLQEVLDEGGIRFDVATRVLDNLRADARRSEGQLERSDVTRAYVRKDLTISECAWVEEVLVSARN